MVDGYIQEYNIKNLNEQEKEIELIKNIIIIPRKVKSSLAGFSSENGSIIWIRRKMVRERPAGEGSRDIAIISAKRKVIC